MRCLWGVNIWAMSCLQLCDLNKDCAWHRNGSYRNGETININNTKTKRRTSFPVHLGFLKTWCGFCILPIKNVFPCTRPLSLLPEKWSCDHPVLAMRKTEASRRQYADSLIVIWYLYVQTNTPGAIYTTFRSTSFSEDPWFCLPLLDWPG